MDIINNMLENNYFIYQPNYFKGSIVSYEALLRFKHSNELPQHFISTIKDKVRFDKDVITHVIADKLSLRYQHNIHISINISVESLESDDFLTYCETIFKEHKGFTLEFNFNKKTFDINKVKINMQRLRKLGIFLTLDDYGTECVYSDPLLELNFDYIKIDRSLISTISDDYLSFCFLRSLYHKLNTFLGNTVVIKGVENINQLNLINSFGSVISQGYHLSYPLPLSELDNNRNIKNILSKTDLSPQAQPIDRFIYNVNIAKNEKELTKALEKLKPQDPFNLLAIDYNDFNLDVLNKKYQELLEGIKSPSILFTTNLMKHCNCLFILRDEHGVAIYNNKKHIDYLGCDLIGMPVQEVLARFPDYQTCLQLDQQLLNKSSDILISNETVEVDSQTTHFHTYRQKIQYFNNTFIVIFIYEDDTAAKISIDSLTSCFTKEKLDHINVNAYNTMVFIDLDGFKNINDKYGHQFGDQQLRKSAQFINQSLRKEDLLIRFGGDEFVLCLNSHSIKDINQKMYTIRSNFEQHFKKNNLELSFSFGSALLDNDIKSAIETADKQMYINKRKRKKCL